MALYKLHYYCFLLLLLLLYFFVKKINSTNVVVNTKYEHTHSTKVYAYITHCYRTDLNN